MVLDEADEMLSMGFIEDIEGILGATPATRQTALFSATMPPEIRRLADRYLRDPKAIATQRTQSDRRRAPRSAITSSMSPTSWPR